MRDRVDRERREDVVRPVPGGAWNTRVVVQCLAPSVDRDTKMLLKLSVRFICGSPVAYTEYTVPVPGSATIGPAMLLNVASAVELPWPTIGDAAACHVWPSSVERITRTSALLPESW